MADWGGGYTSDIEYLTQYIEGQAPSHQAVCCTIAGFAPPRLDRPFAYLDLGCGQGYTALLLATCYPNAQFYGIDFSPTHILRAQEMAEAAGITNVTFIETSFAEAAEAETLPRFDFVAMHGIYTWVSHENRRAIVRILERQVKPGGLVYIAYNALPSRLKDYPVQRLLTEFAARSAGRSDRRAADAVAVVGRLRQAGFRHAQNERLGAILEHIVAQGEIHYLSHDFLTEHWQPEYFADIARDLAAAKLSFVASAHVPEIFPDFCFTPEQRALADAAGDPALRETLKDFAIERPFRADLFMRGARSIDDARRDRTLRAMRFAPLQARSAMHAEVDAPIGRATLNEAAWRSVFDALAQGPRSIAELEAACDGAVAPAELAGVLCATRHGGLVVGDGGADASAARAFNRLVGSDAIEVRDHRMVFLAAPAIGGGRALTPVEFRVFRALIDGMSAPADIVASVARALVARGEGVVRDGKPIEDEAENRRLLAKPVEAIVAGEVPVWRTLGIL